MDEEETVRPDAERQQSRAKDRKKKKTKKEKKEHKKDRKKRERREGRHDVRRTVLEQDTRGLDEDDHPPPNAIKSTKKRKLNDASDPATASRDKNHVNLDSSAVPLAASLSRSLSLRPSSSDPTHHRFPYKYVLAPMVGASELAFRLLCRRYGADLCYTPMMSAGRFATDPVYRESEFQTCPSDRPLVCHFSANRPQDFADAVRAAAPYCDAVDLNLGCPQRTAYVGHFGSYLLDPEDRDLVCSIVRAGVRATNNTIPICCKIRLLDTIDETIELCKQLEAAGASWIAIHARYRASWERQGPGARDGPALLDQVAEIKKHVNIPLIANGNVKTFRDVEANLQFTNADAIMSAEGILDNPALFLPRWGSRSGAAQKVVTVPNIVTSHSPSNGATTTASNDGTSAKSRRKIEKRLREIRRLEERGDTLTKEEQDKVAKKESLLSSLKALEAEIVDTKAGPTDSEPESTSATTLVSLETLHQAADCTLTMALEYLHLVQRFPVKIRSVVFHVRRILKDDLLKYQLMEDLLACEHVDQVLRIVEKIGQYRARPETFVFDQVKAVEQKEALERKKREEGKRKEYEARMMRKAKREGKDPNFYLSLGAAVPTTEEVNQLRSMKREDALDAWKRDHSQHCLSYHLDPEGCKRGRSCAFLHVDANNFVEGDEVAG